MADIKVGNLVRTTAVYTESDSMADMIMVVVRIGEHAGPYPYECEPIALYKPLWEKAFGVGAVRGAVFSAEELEILEDSGEIAGT